ncbi:MAG: MBL fold metallo-hydrolase, partial [Thermodesulfobacteriota bacterium]|nr:MBL fold metallo-hydrolase [Thermodesulfobacteriota bacterium]
MAGDAYFENIQGVLGIFAQDPMWPNPSNMFVIPDEQGFAMIDVGCGGVSGPEYLLGGLKHWGLNLKDLHTIILSHAHPDHMGAMSWILEEIQPKVFIHHLDVVSALNPQNLVNTFDVPLAKRRWAGAEDQSIAQAFDLLNFFEQVGCSMSAASKVDPVNEGDVLGLGAFAFEVIHTPGHSPGHVSLFEKDKGILLSGDVVGRIPAWYTPASGGVIGYYETLAKLEALEAEIILPAHGPVMKDPLTAIKKIRDRLLGTEAAIREILGDGPKNFLEVNAAIFPLLNVQLFPGCGIIESHVLK